jgi:hypothetical protein
MQFLMYRWCLLSVSSSGNRDELALCGLFYKDTNPILEGLILMM